MILTKEKTYTMTITELDQNVESVLNKKERVVEYTNLELLHAIVTCTLPASGMTASFRGKRQAELISRISMVESALEERGDQLVKSEQTMYLDVTERGVISHYLGLIYTKMLSEKLYGIDTMLPIQLMERPKGQERIRYRGIYRPDLIGFCSKNRSYSVWEAIGRSENSLAAFENALCTASEVKRGNGQAPDRRTACMTYYERGYFTAVLKEAPASEDLELDFPEQNYFGSYYRPLLELMEDGAMEKRTKGEEYRYEAELRLPWTGGIHSGFRHLQIGMGEQTMESAKAGCFPEETGKACGSRTECGDRSYTGPDGVRISVDG